MTDLEIRPLGRGDFDGCVEVLVRAFNEMDVRHGIRPSFRTFSQARATLEMATRLDPERQWIAVRGGRKIVGLALSYRRGDYVCIGPVAVHPLAQGTGVGRTIMEHLLEVEDGVRCFSLAQAAPNPHSFTLYRTLGFRVVYPEAVFSGGRPVPGRLPAGDGVHEVSKRRLGDVMALDRELAGVDRSVDLQTICGMGHTFASDDGYLATVRVGASLAVGPGAARDAAGMERLLAAALADVPEGGVLIRAPANGDAFVRLVEWGMLPDLLGNVMARGTWPTRTGEHLHPIFPEIL